MTIPFENVLSSSRAALQGLVPPVHDSLKELESYWALNEMIVNSSAIFYMFDELDVRGQDVSRPREFFDRLRSTRELAYECQGKVEFSFAGYDEDSRELYEIDEVREYVTLLDAALPELFFFARTEMPTYTLITFALCQTKIAWVSGRSTRTVTRKVSFDTDKVAAFCYRHWPGLNEMTEWLGMTMEENKRITFDVVKCFGFNPPQE